MKQFIKKLFNIREIPTAEVEKVLNNYKKPNPLKINFPIGRKTITRSNENGPLLIGHVVDYFGDDGKGWALMIKDEGTGTVFMVMGITHHYSDGKLAALNKLTPHEQWNVMAIYAPKD